MRTVGLAVLVLSGCGAASIPVDAKFQGFTPVAGGDFIVRWTQNDAEIAGTRQSNGVDTAGNVSFQFVLPTGSTIHLQYFIDSNLNKKWDGPVGSFEPSWDRSISVMPPLHNEDSVILTVGYDTQYSALPDDFVAP